MAMNPKKENAVTVRFDDREWIDAAACAASQERSLSEFMRFCVRRYMYGMIGGRAAESQSPISGHQRQIVRTDFEPSGFGDMETQGGQR